MYFNLYNKHLILEDHKNSKNFSKNCINFVFTKICIPDTYDMYT